MKRTFKKFLSGVLAASMLMGAMSFNTSIVSAASSISTAGGWYESLYAEWQDSNPNSSAVKVEYKLSSDTEYTALEGDDLTYLVREASESGYGRVDIPGLKAGKYDIKITTSEGDELTRTGIKVYAKDRSGYAHWNRSSDETAYSGVGAYKDDGTPKDNAVIVYVTDENKNTVTIPGYESKVYNYKSSSTGETWTRSCEGIGNILNNNTQFIKELTIDNDTPVIFRFVGTINAPANLTPPGEKDLALGGSADDNGYLAITKGSRNITLEGVGGDAVINGWGFTFSQTSTTDTNAGQSFEVSNLTFQNYPEDALGFQGEKSGSTNYFIKRVWVHNNTFYKGHADNDASSDGDKADGDGSCDFKRGEYYTMAYNHYVNCHKTNLLGSGSSDSQYYMTLHHNWYENVESRQPLAASGNVHIYNTYFQSASSTTVDTRAYNATFLENNYYENCKNYFKSRNNTCVAKSYNEIISGKSTLGSVSGKRNVVTSRSEAGISDNGLTFPNGDAITNFDTNPAQFYYDSVNNVSDVEVLTATEDVPTYVTAHAGTLKAFNDEEVESGNIVITVKSGSTPITGAKLTAAGLTFKETSTGVYTASTPLGATYSITVSKEGYSNVVVNTTAINEDGGSFETSVNMAVDTDGYAVVKLQGGTNGEAVLGATVKLTDGTELKDQGNGIYKSESQIAVGTYSVNISSTGDYVAPTSAVSITVKTTDEETVISLEKHKGTVTVSLAAASGETTELDPSGATVTVGNTALTYDSSKGVYTGEVEVNTPYSVYVRKAGWNTDSITPSTVTASRTATVTAKAVLSYKGESSVWNYTENVNTLGATVSANDWASAVALDYEDTQLTKAIKMESSTSITFSTEIDGTLTVVAYSTASDPKIKIDGTAYDIEESGATVITLSSGSHTITKGSSSTYLYLLEFDAGEGNTVTTTTTTTTEASTEATTNQVEESTASSQINISVDNVTATDGVAVVPVKISGTEKLGSYVIVLSYDTDDLTAVEVANGNAIASDDYTTSDIDAQYGTVSITAVNPSGTLSGDVLCYVTFNVNATSDIVIEVKDLTTDDDNVSVVPTVTGGTVTAESVEVTYGNGDVNADGKVTAVDAALLLRKLSGFTDTEYKNPAAANCDGKGTEPDLLDVIYILAHQSNDTDSSDTENSAVHKMYFNDGTENSFFTVNGNTTDVSPSVTVNGIEITKALKIESKTSIKFTAGKAGKLKLVFSDDSANIKINGTKYATTNGVIEADIASGDCEITKADTTKLYYISFTEN